MPLHEGCREGRRTNPGGRRGARGGRGSTRGWHLNGDVLYVEPRRQNDSGSKAASASKTKRQKSLKGKSIRRLIPFPRAKLRKINRFSSLFLRLFLAFSPLNMQSTLRQLHSPSPVCVLIFRVSANERRVLTTPKYRFYDATNVRR